MRLILQVPALDKFWLCARGVLYAFSYSVAFHLLLLPDIVFHEGVLCVPMMFHETKYFSGHLKEFGNNTHDSNCTR